MTKPRIDWNALSDNPRANKFGVGGAVAVTVIASIVAIHFWLGTRPVQSITVQRPGMDGSPVGDAAKAVSVDLAGSFVAGDGVPSALEGAWPSFRGPGATNVVADAPELADDWGSDGPKVLWTIPVGDGYAAPAVLNGRVYLMDYDVEKRADAIRCISLDDGREIWRRTYNLDIKRNHGMSRTIPAVTEKYLVTMGPKCHVVCLDTERGDFLWGIDLQKDYGTEEPLWYAGQCPLIDNDVAIIAPGGDEVLMMGVDCATGKVLWETPNPNEFGMSHASIIPMTLLGKRVYVYTAIGGVVCVSAEPENVGELLWHTPVVASVIAPSPVQVSENQVFVTVGYGAGSRLLEVRDVNGKMEVDVVYELPPGEVLACEQQTPIFHNGLLYGIMPKDAGALKGQFACYRPDGTMVWSSGQDHRFGLGPFLYADEKFFLLDDEGTLTMLDAREETYVQLGQADILPGHDSWGPLAMAGSRMLLRDMNNLACIELGSG